MVTIIQLFVRMKGLETQTTYMSPIIDLVKIKAKIRKIDQNKTSFS